MDIERGLILLQKAAERLAWQMDQSGVTGVGTDGSGSVRVELDDAGQVRQVDIGRMWWQEIGPEQLSVAVLDAANQAAADRLKIWSERVAEREGGDPPTDWQSSMDQQRGNDGSNHLRSAESASRESRAEVLLRTSEVTRAALSEVDGYRHRLEARGGQQVVGRGRDNRATVAVKRGQIAEVEISQRWLREQPSGSAVGSEVLAACQDAYDQETEDEAASLAGLPAIVELRELTADPAALLRRLGMAR
ncbi:hypothetical protein [Plantactinospora soyae]|uniref:DNA-binding protein YbaB n=1 Tax=Plantactinospora soyae TaxID=1544732 RepID=A0A927LYW2_9ACTN|nr:hypothetical protein [Plantactinospora soyae]MBE1485073.1 DNA-binding protein YbaB [Plantactinospora soyae]